MIQQQTQWGHRAAMWMAVGFGAGKAPIAPGTAGTLVGIPIYLVLNLLPVWLYVVGVVLLFAVGVRVCDVAERELGKHDHQAIVWDEVVGFLIAMLFAPAGWRWIVIGFLLFRAFDVWKPYPIRRLERLRGGFGVMADDALAGAYACVVLQVLVWYGAY